MNTYTELACQSNSNLNKTEIKSFNISLNATTDLFDRCLNMKIKDLQKIRIDLYDAEKVFNIYEPDKISPICHIEKSFNFSHYFAQAKPDRRKIILETLYECITEMCNQLDYDFEPFTFAYNKVKELDYVNKYIHGKLTFSKNRQQKAGIQIEVNEDAATISVLFTDKDEQSVKQVEILRTLPHYMFIFRVIHKGKWIDNETYQVSDKSGQVHFKVTGYKRTLAPEVFFEPKSHTEEELREVLEDLKINKLL